MTPSRVKVIHVITKLDVGGAQETALRILASLDSSRFESLLVCGPETGSTGSLHDEARSLGIEVRVVPSLIRRISPLHDARTLLSLRRLFRSERPDVVHTHSSKAGVVGRLAGRLAGVPTVVHSVHGWSFRPHMRPPLHWAAVLIERLMAKVSDRLVVVADHDRWEGLANEIGPSEKYVVIRSGIETDRYHRARASRPCVRQHLGVAEGALLVGSVMRLAPPKDPETFLRAAAIVRSRQPASHFLLVGDGPQRCDSERMAADLGLSDCITFTGLRRDVAELMGSLDVFVLSSRSEGLPRTVTEAMASSVPVVANDVGGVSEVVADGITGLLVPPGDANAMADAVLHIISDQLLAERLRREGRDRVQEFDVAAMSCAYRRLYLTAKVAPARSGQLLTAIAHGRAHP